MAAPAPLPTVNANNLITWITKQEFYTKGQQTNYSVAITADNSLIISKVGGVTSATTGMDTLIQHIQNQNWYNVVQGRVYFAKKYGGGGNSNHSEMCCMATADSLDEKLVYIKCTGDNCPACAEMLAHDRVTTGNSTATGTQSGWVHPRGRLAMGTQLGSWEEQLAELREFNATDKAKWARFEHSKTQKLSSDPEGKYELVACAASTPGRPASRTGWPGPPGGWTEDGVGQSPVATTSARSIMSTGTVLRSYR